MTQSANDLSVAPKKQPKNKPPKKQKTNCSSSKRLTLQQKAKTNSKI
jgi:hypothetical protein